MVEVEVVAEGEVVPAAAVHRAHQAHHLDREGVQAEVAAPEALHHQSDHPMVEVNTMAAAQHQPTQRAEGRLSASCQSGSQ